jgi:hypothetical protein
MEYWFTDGKRYFGCDHTAWGKDGSTSNVAAIESDHLHLHRPRLKGMWFLDKMIAKVKSLLGNKCANVFTNRKFTKVVPMTSRKEAAESLIDFSDDVGFPEMLMTDGAAEFTGRHTDFIKQAQ